MNKDFFDQYLRTQDRDRLDSVDNCYLKVVLKLGNVCTYDCSYCHPDNKSGSVPWVDINCAIAAVEEIFKVYQQPPFNKSKIHFELIGGEVTVWKDIDQLLKKIHGLGGETSLMTNASRSLRWWEEFSSYLDHVAISFHPESAEKEHVVSVANILVDKGIPITFQVVMLPELWNKSLDAIDYAVNHGKFKRVFTTKLSVKDTALNRLGIYEWPYTPEQTEWFKLHDKFDVVNPDTAKLKIQKEHYQSGTNYWANSTTGATQEQRSKYTILQQQNNWQGWYCYVGIDTLLLDSSGQVKRASSCKLDPLPGNWLTDISSVEWSADPVQCPFKGCYCGTDIEARKFKNIPINLS